MKQNAIWESIKIANPCDLNDLHGGKFGIPLSNIKPEFDFQDIDSQKFSMSGWELFKRLFDSQSDIVFQEVKDLLLKNNYNGKPIISGVRINDRTHSCGDFQTMSASPSCVVSSDGKLKGQGFTLNRDDCSGINKIRFSKLSIHVREAVSNVQIRLVDALSEDMFTYTRDLVQGENDLIALLGLENPFYLTANKSRMAQILIDPAQFIVNGKNVLKNNIMSCFCNSGCRPDIRVWSIADHLSSAKIKENSSKVENTYGINAVVSAGCDINEVIERHGGKTAVQNLFATKLLFEIERGLTRSNNPTAIVVFNRPQNAEKMKDYFVDYETQKLRLAETILNNARNGTSNGCIECNRGYSSRSPV